MILQLCEVKVIITVTLTKFPHISSSSAQGRALKELKQGRRQLQRYKSII